MDEIKEVSEQYNFQKIISTRLTPIQENKMKYRFNEVFRHKKKIPQKLRLRVLMRPVDKKNIFSEGHTTFSAHNLYTIVKILMTRYQSII